MVRLHLSVVRLLIRIRVRQSKSPWSSMAFMVPAPTTAPAGATALESPVVCTTTAASDLAPATIGTGYRPDTRIVMGLHG